MVREIKETIEQLNIINSKADIKRIIACAGSGKTLVITNNIIKILKEKVCSPDSILALTFTRNAAENMRVRIKENIKRGIDCEGMDIFTFNSFGNEIISENSFQLGLGKDFKIISSSQSWQILYEIFDKSNLQYLKAGKKVGEFIQNLLNHIESLKNNLISIPEFKEYLNNYEEVLATYRSKALRSREKELIDRYKELFDIYRKYEKRKIEDNCVDYSDQVFMPYFLLLERKSIRAKYQQKYKYIFVDEFQDTNIAQAYLLSLLYKPGHNKLVVVGDDDQGIYSFRGACVDNILNLHKFDRFKNYDIQDFYLTTNFRSGNNIINTAGNIISSNRERFEKELKAGDAKKESEVVFFLKKTHREEAAEMAGIIKCLEARGIKLKEMAILARRKRFETIIKELEASNIKFELIGGKNFFFEPEVLFIISWLKIVEDMNDEVSAVYLLRSDKYKIGDRDIYFIKRDPENLERCVDIIDGIMNFKKNPYLSREAKKRLKDFLASLRLYISRSGQLELKELVSLIIEDSGILNELRSGFEPIIRKKIKNVENLIRVASDFQQSYEECDLNGFVTYLKDVAKTDYDDPEIVEFSSENSVKIMSIHAAKGLEFEVVFLPMLWKNDYMGRTSTEEFMAPAELRKDNGIWKEKKNFKSAESFRQALKNIKLEEERRIFYVACSRAKKILILSHSEYEDDETAGNENIKVKEMVPFFDDIISKSSRLKVLNEEGLDFIKTNYHKEIPNGCRSYEDIFNFVRSEKKDKRSILISVENKWQDLQKILVSKILETDSTRKEKDKILKIADKFDSGLIYGNSPADTEKDINFFPLTNILDYKRCPLLYKWKYVYLIPEKGSKELARGEEIHKYLENITLMGFNDNKITEEEIISHFEDNNTRKHIRIFLSSSFWNFSGVKSVMLEQLFYWKIKKYFIVGKLDRVDVNKKDKIRVIDYKISKYFKGKKSRKQDRPENLHQFQLKAYMGALSEIFKKPLKDITGFLFYLKDGVEIPVMIKNADVEEIKQDVVGIMNNIVSNNFKGIFKNSCKKYCSYAGFCSKYL